MSQCLYCKRPWVTGLVVLVVVAMIGCWADAGNSDNALRGLVVAVLGPPTVTPGEAYAQKPDGPKFDHALFDELLKQFVDEHGGVDYAGLAEDTAELDQYIQQLSEVDFDALGRDEKLTLLINAYNAFTLRLIVDYWDDGELESIKDIPKDKRWDHERWQIGKQVFSLSQIEHEQIRPKFQEPRIHFALVCAAYSCPTLRTEAYQADRLEEQLDDQTQYTHSGARWLQFDREDNIVYLTKLYEWYGGDFHQQNDSVLAYVALQVEPVKQAIDAGQPPRIRWLEYDWQLNRQDEPPSVTSP
jgi:hypothetical protein